MSIGPCLCGDPYCPSCGNPHAAELEAAEEQAIDRLGAAGLSPDEYRIVVSVGLAAVAQARKATKAALAEVNRARAEYEAEVLADKQAQEYWDQEIRQL